MRALGLMFPDSLEMCVKRDCYLKKPEWSGWVSTASSGPTEPVVTHKSQAMLFEEMVDLLEMI